MSRAISPMRLNIHGPKITRENMTATIFGMKIRVCSWMDVAVWRMPMTSPTSMATRSTGRAVYFPIRMRSMRRSRS